MVYFENLWHLFVDMSFYIVIGLLFTGALHAFVNQEFILKHVGKKSVSSVVKASVFGVPLPLCSCGVVPTAMYLGKSGASKGAVVSFLTSTPQTGVDSLIATYGLMGPLFAVYRAIAAFVSGIVAGITTNLLSGKEKANYDGVEDTCGCGHDHGHDHGHAHVHAAAVDSHSHGHDHSHGTVESACGCGHDHAHGHAQTAAIDSCGCGHDHSHDTAASSCGCGHEHSEYDASLSFGQRIKSIFTFAFGEFLDEIAVHFVVGLLIATVISTVVPESWLSSFTNPLASMLLMLIIGIPMYICSTASIPIALSLMMKGVSPGAAFVFLFAGPVTNIASLMILLKALGKKVMAIYIGSVAVCSVAFGLLLDYIITTFGYTGISDIVSGAHEEEMSIFMVAVAVGFGLLVARSLLKQLKLKLRSAPHAKNAAQH